MAKEAKNDITCLTNDRPGSVIDAPCKVPCQVSYRLVFKAPLSMPYAVAINGVVMPAFKDGPKRTDGVISLVVESGQTVQLYLNSDAHPAYRQHPVYPVVAADDHVEVVITETAGKWPDTDTPVLTKTTKQVGTGRHVQHLAAKLTGDIWMKVSHRYTPAEVVPLLSAGTRPDVADAVKSIYAGLAAPTLVIQQAAMGDQAACTLTVKFMDSDNPKQNINRYQLLQDGLPRVHPGGYAALFSAALAHGIESLRVTSCWRPMLGSIAHRAGLGLDVDYVGATPMNRQELRVGKARDTSNVSDEEVRRFKVYEAASASAKHAEAEHQAALKHSAQPDLSPEQKAMAQQRLTTSQRERKAAQESNEEARDRWNEERNANEPAGVRLFRTSLLRCSCVAQLFDPWYMEGNTKDGREPEANMQRPLPNGRKGLSNEELHAHHLHVTVYEPKIL